MVQPAGERSLAEEGVHQPAGAGAELLLVFVAALHEVELIWTKPGQAGVRFTNHPAP